jgi:hypothetical protein
MTKPFMRIDSNGGYIGRLAWWNTIDVETMVPIVPLPVRIWGKGPFLLNGWGSAK